VEDFCLWKQGTTSIIVCCCHIKEFLIECGAEYDWICQLDVCLNRESLLQLSIKIYQLASDWSPKTTQMNCDWWKSVVKRRGNALNELGVFYLNQAAAVLGVSGEFTT